MHAPCTTVDENLSCRDRRCRPEVGMMQVPRTRRRV
jgi:hypothetical protein